MKPKTSVEPDHSLRPEFISRLKKEIFLKNMSEDKFRDDVVRPLFLRQGLEDGRELCGPHEEGKDTLFVATTPLGMREVYVVQTKRGNLNLSSDVSQNVITATTQLKTALETPVTFTGSREKKWPSHAILCASGKINPSARKQIVDEVKDPRLSFMDADDLIPRIDSLYPELWLGIDADLFPYLRKLRKAIEESDSALALSDVLPSGSTPSAATDAMFVPLHLNRPLLKVKRISGKTVRVPDFVQIPIEGLLKSKDKNILILGEAGAGKSTSLRRIAYKMAEQSMSETSRTRIPIILRAIDIASSEQSVVELCANETARLSLSGKPCFSSESLSVGDVAVLVDALDEVANNDERRSILKRLADFSALYPACQVVITSRDYSFLRDLGELSAYKTYRLSPIDWRQVRQIIERLRRGKALPPEMTQELLRRLQEVHGMELNPLLVTVFVATSDYGRRDIPANITELFKKFTELMLGRWDATKGLSQQYQAPLKDFVLRKLAWEMHRRRVTSLSITECQDFIEKELAIRATKVVTSELMDELFNRSSLFRFVGDQVEFRHHILQEFFAGRGIDSDSFLASVVSDEWWLRPVVFYFGDHPSDHATINTIIDSIKTRTPREIFHAAMAIGLALQACYLVPISNRVNFLRWVIEGLSVQGTGFLEGSNVPLARFLTYYLFARDSVASDVLREHFAAIADPWTNEGISKDERDLRTYWILVGLVESGAVEEAETVIKDFHPSDQKLLLAIHLGCYLLTHLRVATRDQKKAAERICSRLAPAIEHLRLKLLEEFNTQLLEVQQGRIKEISEKTP